MVVLELPLQYLRSRMSFEMLRRARHVQFIDLITHMKELKYTLSPQERKNGEYTDSTDSRLFPTV